MNKVLNLKMRLYIQTLSFIILTIILIMGISLFSFTGINESSTNSLTQQIIDQVTTNINNYISDLERVSALLNYDHDVQSYLSGQYQNSKEEYVLKQNATTLLENIKKLRTDVEALIVFANDGRYIYNQSAGSIDKSYNFYSQPFYEQAHSGELALYRPRIQEYFINDNRLVFSGVKSINSYDSQAVNGVILMDLNMSALRNICSNVRVGQDGYVMIVDTDGKLIFHPDYSYIYKSVNNTFDDEITYDDDIAEMVVVEQQTNFIFTTEDNKHLYITAKQVLGTDWTVIGVYPSEDIVSKQQSVANVIIFAGLLCIAIGFFGTILTSNMIFTPLKRLQLKMKLAEEGVFEISPEGLRNDEIGNLSESYNSMVMRINDLIQRTKKDEKEKRKIELRLLQAQINPHFLYNTLDSIVWMAETKKDEVAIMADSLAKLFRLSLAKGREIITVKEEIEHVANYLTIQKMRYAKKFDYIIDVDKDIYNLQTLKLTLQPIVENALYHGIKLKRQKGIIIIQGYIEGSNVLFRVLDDGPGISSEKLETILTEETIDEKRLGGIGLKNVNERLKLYYGQEYGLSFISIEDVGTVVDILIPAKEYTEGMNEII